MNVDVENQYYNSKGLVETDPEAALAGNTEVVRMEPKKAEWGFTALKQTVKIYYRLGRYKEMMEAYRVMLIYIKSAVTRNYSEKCINNIMHFVSGSASQKSDLLREFYHTTLKALEEAKNERLWFKTNLKLGQIWFNMREYGRMSKILKELHKCCQKEDGTDDQKKVNFLRYMLLRFICTQRLRITKSLWAEAATDFFEAFKNYMMKYKNEPEISAMTNLIAAYKKNEIMEFEKILKELKVPEKDVEQLLVSLILDNQIDGHIDQ
ncbi:hypothetical protein UlMin_007297, partial [Ulmus minor]